MLIFGAGPILLNNAVLCVCVFFCTVELQEEVAGVSCEYVVRVNTRVFARETSAKQRQKTFFGLTV